MLEDRAGSLLLTLSKKTGQLQRRAVWIGSQTARQQQSALVYVTTPVSRIFSKSLPRASCLMDL